MFSGVSPERDETPSCTAYSLIHLLLLNALICGLEFCASAGFTYIPPILLKAGVPEEYMSVALSGGPAMGVFMVPVIARLSDRCTCRIGRRLPFIIFLSLVVILSMLLIPYGQAIGRYADEPRLGIVLISIGVMLLDFGTAACFNPLEALFSDMFQSTDKQNLCFVIYSSMISIGGCIGNLITALDWTQSSVSTYLGNQERSAFALLMMMFVVTLFCTLVAARDRPYKPRSASTSIDEHGYESDSSEEPVHDLLVMRERGDTTLVPRLVHRSGCRRVINYVYASVARPFRFVLSTFSYIVFAPFVLRRLFYAHLACWTALYCHNLFYTDFVGHAVYGGVPNAEENSFERNMYDLGVRAGSWGLFLHCITSAAFSAVLDRVVAVVGVQTTYVFGMASFTAAIVVSIFVRNIYVLSVVTAVTGFAFATVTVIPFTLVAEYHSHKDTYFSDVTPHQAKSRGVGSDMAILDTAYFVAQILVSSFMGYLVHVTGTVLVYMVTAAVLGVIGCWCTWRVIYDKSYLELRSTMSP